MKARRLITAAGAIALVIIAAVVLSPSETPESLTPEQTRGRDAFYSSALGQSGKACADCHPDASDLVGVAATYPREVADTVLTFEGMIDRCVVLSLGGSPIADADSMQAIVAYITRRDAERR